MQYSYHHRRSRLRTRVFIIFLFIMANKVISWLEETEEVFLDDSDDNVADPSYGEPVELRENESDSDISEPTPSTTSTITHRSNTSQTSRSRIHSPIAQNSYYLGKDKQSKWYKDASPRNVRTRQRNIVLRLPGRDANSILECWYLFLLIPLLTIW